MSMDFQKAAECFQEIINTINPQTEPEKWNLYSGLLNMALGLMKLAQITESKS